MRIAQIAPLAESVPPKLYGGSERVVSWLTEELVALGHDVTLFASGDSTTKAKLVPVWPRATRLSRPRPDPMATQAALLEAVARECRRFDVIHCHIDWIQLPLLGRLGVPFLTTLHGRLDLPYLRGLMRIFPDAPFVSISESQRRPLRQLNWVGTIPHGLPADTFEPSLRAGNYLAFLGRITPEKGPDVAIRIAKATGLPLRIAAKIPRDQGRYFKEKIEPFVDGSQIRFVGEVDEAGKKSLLGNAAALIFPISWPEPFGLVLIEAMACGTPVIAFGQGSVPEIIQNGINGFVVENEAEAVRAVEHLGRLDRRQVRRAFDSRFTARRMAEDYMAAYVRVAGTAQTADIDEAAIPIATSQEPDELAPLV